MPAIRLLPPETSHRLAVLACKYKLFDNDSKNDPEILVCFIKSSYLVFHDL